MHHRGYSIPGSMQNNESSSVSKNQTHYHNLVTHSRPFLGLAELSSQKLAAHGLFGTLSQNLSAKQLHEDFQVIGTNVGRLSKDALQISGTGAAAGMLQKNSQAAGPNSGGTRKNRPFSAAIVRSNAQA